MPLIYPGLRIFHRILYGEKSISLTIIKFMKESLIARLT